MAVGAILKCKGCNQRPYNAVLSAHNQRHLRQHLPTPRHSWLGCGRRLWEREYNCTSIRLLKTICSCRDCYKMYCDKFCNVYPLSIILLSAVADLLQCAEQRTNTLLGSHIYPMPFELKPKKSLLSLSGMRFSHSTRASLSMYLAFSLTSIVMPLVL